MASESKEPDYSPAQRRRIREPGVGKGKYTRAHKGTSIRGVPYQILKKRGLPVGGNPNITQGARNQKPRPRQIAAVEEFLAHPERSDTANLIAAGYEPNGASTNAPNRVGAKGFQEYLDQRVPDEKLSDLISQGLGAEKAPAGYDDFMPDWANRHKFLETALRLKGYGKEEPPAIQVNFVNAIPRPKKND
jgi:hypothetical protein